MRNFPRMAARWPREKLAPLTSGFDGAGHGRLGFGRQAARRRIEGEQVDGSQGSPDMAAKQ
jgi:hypothetical protein